MWFLSSVKFKLHNLLYLTIESNTIRKKISYTHQEMQMLLVTAHYCKSILFQIRCLFNGRKEQWCTAPCGALGQFWQERCNYLIGHTCGLIFLAVWFVYGITTGLQENILLFITVLTKLCRLSEQSVNFPSLYKPS